MLDRLIRFIGSIKLAVPLLSAIIGILISATFYESQVGSTTVQQEVYKSPWFGALMFMLALNLSVSAISRYPWRGARKVGFALTHFGLVVIIAGSAAVIHLGMEGMLLVRTDRDAGDRLRMQGDLLEVVNSDRLEQGSIFVKQDGSVSPRFVAGLELEAYTDNAVQEISFVEGEEINNPGVRLSLASDRMGQTIDRTLAISPNVYSKVSLGPAELELVEVKSKGELKSLLQPQSNRHPWGELEIATPTKKRIVDVKSNRGKTIKVGNIKIAIDDFYPDFRLDRDKQPATASENYNNPAITLEVTSSQGRERWYVFGKADFPPVRTLISKKAIDNLTLDYQIQPPEVKDFFKVIVTDDKKLYYAAKSSTKFKSGSLTVGKEVSPGWADFRITLDEYLPHAQLQRKIMPTNNKKVRGAPALLVKTKSGRETWLPWGEASAIQDGDNTIYAAFSPKLYQIPFGIKLEDFIVDRNEGSQSVAMWTSKIRIEDPANNNVEQRKVWMNHPTWYKGWKIAQASWNPGDLQQSTLQVKREPAWVTALTWIGSGLVILGIGIMFYAPVIGKKLRQKPKTETSEAISVNKSQEQELTTI